MQYEITNKYKAYEYEKKFKFLFERTNRHRRKDEELGPWFTASDLGGTVTAKRRMFHEKIKN